MKIVTDTTEFRLQQETAVTIGKFDGVHIGHRQLLQQILSCKKQGLAACVFTFDPAPAVLFGLSDAKVLTTKEEKRLLFERMGVDILIEFPLDAHTAAMDPEVFVRKVLADQMKVRLLAAGTDLSFGAGGAGDVKLLKRLSPQLDFDIKIIDKVCVEGQEVSSTSVRACVEEGNLTLAGRMLGIPYFIAGTVVHGNRIGNTLGFPTINLLPQKEKLLPPNGVYFSEVLYRGKKYRAISNTGNKPTVTKDAVCGVETYLYDFDEEIYGEFVEVSLFEFRRPERRFADLAALKKQLEEDIAAGEAYSIKNMVY